MKMNKTRQNTMEMQTLVLGLLAVWGGATMTLDFICTGAAPVKGAWTPTVAQAKNALHRYIKDAVANRKVASNLPVKCDHAGAIKASKVKFTPSAKTGKVPVLAYHMEKLRYAAHLTAKAAKREAGLKQAIADGGVWIARGVFDGDGNIRGYPSQRKAAAAWCRTFIPPTNGKQWHEREDAKDLRKQARTHTQRAAWLIMDGLTITTEGNISQDEVILLAAKEFGFKGKTAKGAQAFLDRNVA